MTDSIETSAAPASNEVHPAFGSLIGQPVASAFLTAAAASPYLPQAFLFYGSSESSQTEAAVQFAQVLLCLAGADDNCNDCRQVKLQIHPDLTVLVPEGASGYLNEQMQQLNRDASLAPIRAKNKVFVISQADRMTVGFANAFLKLLEEPPASVVFILLARNLDTVIPTIRSRCQLVPFFTVPENLQIRLLVEELKVTAEDARIALAYSAGSYQAAQEYLTGRNLKELRQQLIECFRRLPNFDALDTLDAAKALLVALKLPLDELKIQQEQRIEERREVLSRAALTSLEQRHKRELTAAERRSAHWVIQAIRVWLRDILLLASGLTDSLVNTDQRDLLELYVGLHSHVGPAVMRCLEACFEADQDLDYNVSVQSIFEYLLFTLRGELGKR
ncbi:MAG: DNA polymerase III subunit delta' [Coriobacteriia bacterium]|nr:DNA polymerase III subunit delta' [Coriobacteriia bacterium]